MALSEYRSSFSPCLLPGPASQCRQTSLCSSCLQAAGGEAEVKVVNKLFNKSWEASLAKFLQTSRCSSCLQAAADEAEVKIMRSTLQQVLGSFPRRVPADLSVFLRPADKHIFPIPHSRLSSNFVHGGFKMSSSSSTINSVLSLPPSSPSLGIELHLSFGSSNITYVLSLPLPPPAWAWSSTCPPPALYG